MTPGAIRKALIERGWLEDTEAPHKRFYSTIFQMTKRGRLLRLHDKRYVAPPSRPGGDTMT